MRHIVECRILVDDAAGAHEIAKALHTALAAYSPEPLVAFAPLRGRGDADTLSIATHPTATRVYRDGMLLGPEPTQVPGPDAAPIKAPDATPAEDEATAAAERKAELEMLGIQACPECRAGKHRNCDGTTWNNRLDRSVRCPCAWSKQGPHTEKRYEFSDGEG